MTPAPPSDGSSSRRRWPALALVLALGLAACGSDGRELRPPDPDQTTTTAAEGAADADAGTTEATDAAMTVASQTLSEGGEVPARHTCEGEDVSPALQWSNLPGGTAEVAVVMRDLDADGFVHWVLAGLPADLGEVAEGTVPEGAVEATNDFGRPGWGGPCPPSDTHHYEIRVYALAEPVSMEPGLAGQLAAELIETAPVLASAALSATATAAG